MSHINGSVVEQPDYELGRVLSGGKRGSRRCAVCPTGSCQHTQFGPERAGSHSKCMFISDLRLVSSMHMILRG